MPVTRSAGRARLRPREIGLALAVVVVALAVRYPFLPHESGDYREHLSGWYDFIVFNGYFHSWQYGFSNYNPPYLYLLTAAAYFLPSAPALLAVKGISILGDFTLALFSYRCVRLRYPESRTLPLLASGAALLAPTVVLDSAGRGQADAIYTAFLMACLYGLLSGRRVLAFAAFGLAFSFKAQAAFLAPLLYWLSAKKVVGVRHFWLIPAVFLAALVPAASAGRPPLDLLLIYFKQVGQVSKLSAGLPNLHQWISNDYFRWWPAGVLLTLALVYGVRRLLESRRLEMTRETVVLLALFSVLLVPFFLPKMLGRYFFPADVFAIVLAFYRPRLWYLPAAVWAASLTAYAAFFSVWPEAPLGWAAALPLAVLVDLTRRLLLHLGFRFDLRAAGRWLGRRARAAGAAAAPLLTLLLALGALFPVFAADGRLARPLQNDGESARTLARAAALSSGYQPGGVVGSRFPVRRGESPRRIGPPGHGADARRRRAPRVRSGPRRLGRLRPPAGRGRRCPRALRRRPLRAGSRGEVADAGAALGGGAVRLPVALPGAGVPLAGAPGLQPVDRAYGDAAGVRFGGGGGCGHGVGFGGAGGFRRFRRLPRDGGVLRGGAVRTVAREERGGAAAAGLFGGGAARAVRGPGSRGRVAAAAPPGGRGRGGTVPPSFPGGFAAGRPVRESVPGARGVLRGLLGGTGGGGRGRRGGGRSFRGGGGGGGPPPPGDTETVGGAASGQMFPEGLRRVGSGFVPPAALPGGRPSGEGRKRGWAAAGALLAAAGLAGAALLRSFPLVVLALSGLGSALWLGRGAPAEVAALGALGLPLAAWTAGFAGLRRRWGGWWAYAAAGVAAALWASSWAGCLPSAGRAFGPGDDRPPAPETRAATERLREDFRRIQRVLRERAEPTVFLPPLRVGNGTLGGARARFFLREVVVIDDPARRAFAEFTIEAGPGSAAGLLTPENQEVFLHHRAARDGELDRLIEAAGPPVVRSEFDVHFGGGRLLLVKTGCRPEHRGGRFHLHLRPEDPDDLPPHRKPYGFENRSFRFLRHAYEVGDRCVAGVRVPEYPIRRVVAGRFFRRARGAYEHVWRVEFSPPDGAGRESHGPGAGGRAPRRSG